jgi:hypothetical protein
MARNANPDETAGRSSRISLPLLDDGTVDWDHVRPSTMEKFAVIVKTDKNVRDTYEEAFGPPPGGESPFGGITEENVATGLDLVCNINALVFRVAAARFVKNPFVKDKAGRPVPLVIDEDILSRTFRLTPEQHKELDPRATRLAEKYSRDLPEWLKKNMDLYMFASMFLAYTAQNAKTALQAQIARDRAQGAYAAARANQPQNPKPDTDAVRTEPSTQPTNGHDRTPPTYTYDGMSTHVADTPDMDRDREAGAAPPGVPLV